jgi:hypothetical protein
MEQKIKCDSPELGLGNGRCSDDLDGFSELNRQGDGVSQVGRVGGHLAREGSPPVSVKQSESRGKGESFGERVQRHRSLKVILFGYGVYAQVDCCLCWDCGCLDAEV